MQKGMVTWVMLSPLNSGAESFKIPDVSGQRQLRYARQRIWLDKASTSWSLDRNIELTGCRQEGAKDVDFYILEVTAQADLTRGGDDSPAQASYLILPVILWNN